MIYAFCASKRRCKYCTQISFETRIHLLCVRNHFSSLELIRGTAKRALVQAHTNVKTNLQNPSYMKAASISKETFLYISIMQYFLSWSFTSYVVELFLHAFSFVAAFCFFVCFGRLNTQSNTITCFRFDICRDASFRFKLLAFSILTSLGILYIKLISFCV